LDRSQIGHATVGDCDHGYILIANAFAASTAIMGTFHACEFTQVVTARDLADRQSSTTRQCHLICENFNAR
jgi:hypothetical protein